MIENVFEELKTSGIVRSGNEFSREWLGMEESYLRGLRSKDRSPSIRAWLNCSNRLWNAGNSLITSDMSEVKGKGLMLKRLADTCAFQAIGTEVGELLRTSVEQPKELR